MDDRRDRRVGKISRCRHGVKPVVDLPTDTSNPGQTRMRSGSPKTFHLAKGERAPAVSRKPISGSQCSRREATGQNGSIFDRSSAQRIESEPGPASGVANLPKRHRGTSRLAKR
ncbi:hypothetical protein ZHAS_00003373 [Anopheles sinensis]|uniref:Uncharacterized protein n=1 Tax=Anopheles sinensis TaxID=74873 RepID=A0A084VE63_ANOSI|nr:hypothetical protein ZHAS_00003373 [Anopheles sinensis]